MKNDRDLLSIGQFADLCGVSIKALHHYDRTGVLSPAFVDPRTCYRYYRVEQIATMQSISELSALGLPLRVIVKLAAAGFPSSSVRVALERQKLEVAERIRREAGTLRQIERKLDGESTGFGGFVRKLVPALRVRRVREQLGTVGDADELVRSMNADARARTGTIWHACGKEDGAIDCEAVVITKSSDNGVITLPGARVISIVHTGSDSSISETYQRAWTWLAQQGLELSAPVREWYHKRRGGELTEIQFPVESVGERSAATDRRMHRRRSGADL